jgi:hypothetical protein
MGRNRATPYKIRTESTHKTSQMFWLTRRLAMSWRLWRSGCVGKYGILGRLLVDITTRPLRFRRIHLVVLRPCSCSYCRGRIGSLRTRDPMEILVGAAAVFRIPYGCMHSRPDALRQQHSCKVRHVKPQGIHVMMMR